MAIEVMPVASPITGSNKKKYDVTRSRLGVTVKLTDSHYDKSIQYTDCAGGKPSAR